MGLEKGMQVACLDEQAALDFVQGRLGEVEIERLDEHVDECDRCRMVLAEATRAFRERTATAPARVSFTRFAPGDILAGRYRILRFIARGGMGEVYEAEDSILNTRLALKTLAATISDDPHATRRLKQEVNLARRITHPNVCRIFDLGIHEQANSGAAQGQLFITMELVPGGSLGERLRKEGRLHPQEAAPIVQSMVAAIGAAHRAKIVHRDFKSDNVMLAPEEGGTQRVVVMDFGLARAALAGDTSSIDGHALAGTLPYMSPEQLQGQTIGPATDIYALGVVIFEMLTGQLPFKDQPPLAAAWRRVVEPPPPLASFVADLDPGWQRIVTACLERDPDRRFALFDEVAELLGSLEGGKGARLARVGGQGFWTRPRQFAVGLSAVVAAAFLVAVARKPAERVALATRSVTTVPAGSPVAVKREELPAAPQLARAELVTEATSMRTVLSRERPAEVAPPRKVATRGRSVQKRGAIAPRVPIEPEDRASSPWLPEAPPTSDEGSPASAPGISNARPRSKDPNDGFIE